MKFSISLILLLCLNVIFADPLLVVVIMVKDEASVIIPTLQPYVDGGIKHFLIFDTGSTDGTQQIAQEFFKEHNLMNAYVVEEAFIDFATSRNHALDAAHILFPQATFILMPDAEWYMHKVEGLLQFCEEHQNDDQDYYLVPIRSTALDFYTGRLIRTHTNLRFVGSRHETLNKVATVKLPYDVYFEWRPSVKGNEKSINRWKNDVIDLLKSFGQNPHDDRTLFYLAQTYHCLGDWENAYIFYKKRAQICGFAEENYVTKYRMGNVAENLPENDEKQICPLAVQHYLEAFAMRPHRAEPLIKIAQYYLKKEQIPLAFLFALRAAKMPYPQNEILSIEKYMYEFTRYDVLGISAWYVGEYEIGEWAVKEALKVHPDAPHLLYNLRIYTERKAQTGV